jgi:hypothetical protein
MSKTTVPTLKREHNVGENEITKKTICYHFALNLNYYSCSYGISYES